MNSINIIIEGPVFFLQETQIRMIKVYTNLMNYINIVIDKMFKHANKIHALLFITNFHEVLSSLHRKKTSPRPTRTLNTSLFFFLTLHLTLTTPLHMHNVQEKSDRTKNSRNFVILKSRIIYM